MGPLQYFSLLAMLLFTMCMGVFLPLALFFLIRRRQAIESGAFFVGAAFFWIFALSLERAFILAAGYVLSDSLMGSPWFRLCFFSLCAALFEETGRVMAFRFFLKKEREEDFQALLYGAGHGGMEAFFILVITMFNNILFLHLEWFGVLEPALSILAPGGQISRQALWEMLFSVSPLMFLAALWERMFVMGFHLAASVLVWFGVKYKEYRYLIFVSGLMHFLFNILATGILELTGNLWFTELVIGLASLLSLGIGGLVWKKLYRAPYISVDRMRRSDAYTIANHVDSRTLMYRAGEAVCRSAAFSGRVALCCGSGNNAGDGYVMAEILWDKGISCRLFLLEERFSKDGAYYFSRCMERGISWEYWSASSDLSGYSYIVDCIYGTGFHGRPSPKAENMMEAINRAPGEVISVDINSGLHGDVYQREHLTKGVFGRRVPKKGIKKEIFSRAVVRSDLTVSIGYYKRAHYDPDCRRYMKRILNRDIGIHLAEEPS